MNWGWKTAGSALALTIAGLGILGLRAVPVQGDPGNWLKWFDLDGELNVVVAFSAFLLLATGMLVIQLVRLGQFPRSAMILGGIFIFMAFDEALKIHETCEKLTGIDWQIAYLPIFLAAGLGWLQVWWNRKGLTRVLWTAGAACWFVSQAFEHIQWGGWGGPDETIGSYTILMVSEELLEMIGSSLFLLTLFRLRWPGGIKGSRDDSSPRTIDPGNEEFREA